MERMARNQASSLLFELQLFAQTPTSSSPRTDWRQQIFIQSWNIQPCTSAGMFLITGHADRRSAGDRMTSDICLPFERHKQMNKYGRAKHLSSGPVEGSTEGKGEVNKSWHTRVYKNNTGKMHSSLPTGGRVNTHSDKISGERWGLPVERGGRWLFRRWSGRMKRAKPPQWASVRARTHTFAASHRTSHGTIIAGNIRSSWNHEGLASNIWVLIWHSKGKEVQENKQV